MLWTGMALFFKFNRNAMRPLRVVCAGLLAMGAVMLHTVTARQIETAAPHTIPPPLQLGLVPVATGFGQPTNIVHAGDGRLFIAERRGRIRIIQPDGTVLPTPFLNISSLVRINGSGEQGFLGLAFHPDYARNGYFFVKYNDLQNDTVVARYEVSATNPNRADAGSELILFTAAQPTVFHNGGDLQFGPDGYLYISLGDGGPNGDPQNHAQNLGNLLGKILRVDVDQGFSSAPDCKGAGGNYRVPATNPFLDGTNGPHCDEIWAIGLRNPWRFSFDRLTGDMYIGDVGQNSWEEVNFRPAASSGGENYGWHCYEAFHPFDSDNCEAASSYIMPIFEYPHAAGCAVTGGYVYRGLLHPIMFGRYIFADFCNGQFHTLFRNGNNWVSAQVGQFSAAWSTLGEDVNGELYAADYLTGTLYRLTASQLYQLFLPIVAKQ